MRRPRLSSITAIAVLALLLAPGGTATAAHRYVIISTSQIAPRVLKKLREDFGALGRAVAVGVAGAQGPAGTQGVAGSTGPPGAQGSGATGSRGLNGLEGATGPTGPAGGGPTGPAGPEGTKGLAGTTGSTGPAGAKGLAGATGSTGPAGTKGLAGVTGPEGPSGATGPTGSLSTLTEVEGEAAPLDSTHLQNFSQAECPTGKSPVSGGGFTTAQIDDLSASYMSENHRAWIAQGHVANEAAPGKGSVTAVVYCANTG
jgi:hypothetical protein